MPPEDSTIYVNRLTLDDRSIIPEHFLDRRITLMRHENRKPFSLFDYQETLSKKPSTLGELRHAFTESDAYKEIVLQEKGRGIWAWTFLLGCEKEYEGQPGMRVVTNPEELFYKDGIWRVSGGISTIQPMVQSGWVTRYHPFTGVPVEVSEDRRTAEDIVGEGLSYFHILPPRPGETYAILVGNPLPSLCNPDNKGPFYISAFLKPDARVSGVGVRISHRI